MQLQNSVHLYPGEWWRWWWVAFDAFRIFITILHFLLLPMLFDVPATAHQKCNFSSFSLPSGLFFPLLWSHCKPCAVIAMHINFIRKVHSLLLQRHPPPPTIELDIFTINILCVLKKLKIFLRIYFYMTFEVAAFTSSISFLISHFSDAKIKRTSTLNRFIVNDVSVFFFIFFVFRKIKKSREMQNFPFCRP